MRVCIALVVALVTAASSQAAPDRLSGCSRPLTYDVVRVDPQFHVSRAQFVALLERAERLWEIPFHRNLLEYQPGGVVHVSLISNAKTVAYLQRARAEKTIAAKDAVIARERASLERATRGLHVRETELHSRQAALKQRIDYWNARGGAPAKLFAQLTTENGTVDGLVASFNRDLDRERRAQASFNALVQARNALVHRIGPRSRNELGDAQVGGTDMQIVALTGNAGDDATVAAHEFGHILGLGHIPGPRNIMNPYLVGPLTHASPADLRALAQACA